jgi:hypothetical protein
MSIFKPALPFVVYVLFAKLYGAEVNMRRTTNETIIWWENRHRVYPLFNASRYGYLS